MKKEAVASAKAKSFLKTIEKMSKLCNFDSSLMAALPSALNKEPALRTGFDALTIQELDTEFSKNIGALEKVIADAEPDRAERAGTVQTAQSARDSAEETRLTNVTDLARAEAAQKQGEVALHEASLAVTNFLPELKSVMDACDAAKAKLSAFRDGPLMVFSELKDKASPPPPAIEETADDEMNTVVMEEAAVKPLDVTEEAALKPPETTENAALKPSDVTEETAVVTQTMEPNAKLGVDAEGIVPVPAVVVSGAGA